MHLHLNTDRLICGYLQTTFFLQFKNAHLECRIRQRCFEYLKPWYVKTFKDRSSCCCIYHVEMDMMKVSLSNMRDQLHGLHASLGCNCTCEVCGVGDAGCCAHIKNFKRMTLLW